MFGHRARLRLALAVIGCALLTRVVADAQEIAIPRARVGETRNFTIDARFGYSWVGVAFAECSVDFTPGRRTNPAVVPPPPRTADPRVAVPCHYRLNLACGGWCQFHEAMRGNSLSDVGTYRLRCEVMSGRVVDTERCPLIECRDSMPCPAGAIVGDTTTREFRVYSLEVYNNPPQATPIVTPGVGHVREMLTFRAQERDLDGTGLRFEWRLTPPSGATARLSSTTIANPTMIPMSPSDIGAWSGVLRIVDTEGELGEFPFRFTIENRLPEFEITGPRTVRALGHIRLAVDHPEDPDGDPVTRSWELLSVPRGASRGPGSLGDAPSIDIETRGPNDVGPWEFAVTQTDRRTGSAPVRRTATVMVEPAPPTIDLDRTGTINVRVGDPPVRITDRQTTDAYGRPLSSFRWVLHHVPVSAGIPLGTYDSDPTVEIPTNATAAGTWVVRLTVTDASGSTATERVKVHVDAAPVARIVGPAAGENLASAVSLGGETSTDPDSLDHHRDIPSEVTEGIATYTWRVMAVPEDAPASLRPGTIDDVFPTVGGRRPTLFLPPRTLVPGDWQFALDVRDAEMRTATATHWIHITDAQVPPLAILGDVVEPPIADIEGRLPADLVIDGSESYDPDELLTTERRPGLGIDHYTWTVVGAPPGCTTIPDLADGPTATTATLYRADVAIPTACLGTYTIELTVRDTDSPMPRTGRATTTVTISNCRNDICIDFPRERAALYVRSSDRTDVIVHYHLNSSLYDRPDIGTRLGLRVHMLITRDGEVAPTYSNSWDLDLLPTDRGGRLVLHWHGLTDRNEFPQTGMYGITLQVTDSGGAALTPPVTEPRAIFIETLQVGLTTNRYVNRNQLTTGPPGPIRLAYALTGVPPTFLGFNEARFRIFRRGGAAVFEATRPATTATADLPWDGRDATGTIIPPGDYEAEIELLDHGARLARSERQRITLYEFTLTARGAALSGSRPGLYVMVNADDDNLNGTLDSAETGTAGENDLVDLLLTMAPPAIEGSVAVSMPAPARGALYARADKTAPLPARVGVLPGGLHVHLEGTSAGAGTISVALEPTGAPAQPAQTFPVTAVELVAVHDTSGDFRVGPGDTVTPFVRVGLWDHAFRPDGTLRNENDGLSLVLGSTDNFVGGDSRRFYFRVTDPSANADSAAFEDIAVPRFEWWTLDAAGADADHPTNPSATLRETAADSGIFATAAVMVVSDGVDATVGTRRGLLDQPGIAIRGETDHRTRSVSRPVTNPPDPGYPNEIASPDGSIVANYAPRGTAGVVLSARLPLFNRNPDERRSIYVHWFNFGHPVMGPAPVDPAVVQRLLERIRQRYVVMGVRVHFQHNPATDVINLPAASTVNLNNVTPQGPGATLIVHSPDQTVLVDLVNAAFPRTPANEDVLRLLFIGGLSDMARGESLPDLFNESGPAHRGFVFIAARAPGLETTPPHEIGHILHDGVPPDGGHYTGPDAAFNLMLGPTRDTDPPMYTDSRRLWNDGIHALQINRFLMSRFIKP